jgi:hypothetical protein
MVMQRWLAIVVVVLSPAVLRAEELTGPQKTQQELMADRGYVRYRGGWRTVQEIELIERAERANLARIEWQGRLEKLRKRLGEAGQAEQAAEEMREIADPFAVPALSAAVATETERRVRGFYVEALSRIRAPDATLALATLAVDHADRETRIAAAERLAAIGPGQAMPIIIAGLSSPDNARVNRSAEAIRRLVEPPAGEASADGKTPRPLDPQLLGALIAALQTQHLGLAGDGTPEGSTSATFTPSGGGLSVGGGTKRVKVTVRNDAVLEALVALTGVNFEWDSTAWRTWLASREAPAEYDLRRGW